MANLFRIENGTVYVTFSNCNEEFLCDIDDWEDKLAAMEDAYYKKFTAMEVAMAKLQSKPIPDML